MLLNATHVMLTTIDQFKLKHLIIKIVIINVNHNNLFICKYNGYTLVKGLRLKYIQYNFYNLIW